MNVKKILSLLLLMTIGTSAFAQWTQEINQDFRNSKTVAITVDYSNVKICGMPLDKYREYFAKKYDVAENYLDFILEAFVYNMREALWYKSKKKMVSANQASYELIVYINEISEDAGFKGFFFVCDKIDNCTTKTGLKLDCKGRAVDGSEKSFEKALLKNASKRMKHLHVRENPFFFPYYEYE